MNLKNIAIFLIASIMGITPLFARAEIILHSGSLPSQYVDIIQQKINSNFFTPQEAKQKRWKGEVKVKLIINNEGDIKTAQVIESSGYPLLDKAAIWTLNNAAPFLPLASIKKEEAELTLTLVYGKPSRKKPKRTSGQADQNRYRSQRIPVSSASAQAFWEEKEEEKQTEKRPSHKQVKTEPSPRYQPPIAKPKGLSYKSAKKGSSPASFSFLEKKEEIGTLFHIAKKDSYPLKIARDQIDLSTVKVRETFRNLFPFLGVEYTSTEGKTITDPYESKSYGLKAQHILYDSGQRSYSLRREKLNVGVAQENYKKIRNDLLFEVLKGYYHFQKEKQALSLLKTAGGKFDAYFDTGTTLKQGRLITEIEYLKIQNIYHKVAAEIISQENQYGLSVANLKRVLGISPQEDLPALSPLQFKENLPLPHTLSECINIGLGKRTEVELWEKSIKATDLGYRVAKVENRPKLIMESFWGRSGEAYGYQELDLAETWNVVGKVVWLFGGSSFETSLTGEETVPTDITEISTKTEATTLTVRANLLDKLSYYTETKEGKVALKQAEDELVELNKTIAWDVQEGFSIYNEARKRLESFKKEIETDAKDIALKEELFKAGEIPLSGLMEAELKITSTQLSLLKAKLEMYLGLVVLDKASGFNLNLIEEL